MRISRDLDQAPGIYIYVYSSIDGEFCITHQTEKRGAQVRKKAACVEIQPQSTLNGDNSSTRLLKLMYKPNQLDSAKLSNPRIHEPPKFTEEQQAWSWQDGWIYV